MGAVTGWLILSSITAALGSSFLFGYNIAKLNTPAALIRQFYNESYYKRFNLQMPAGTLDVLWSATISVYVAMGAIGSFLSGWVADNLGRKRAILFNHGLAIVGATLEGVCRAAGVPELLIVGRVIIGLNCGLTMGLVPMYLTELSPQSIRGAVAAMHQLGVVFGILIAQILGLDSLLGTEDRWHLLCGFSGITPLVASFVLPFCPESPRFLLLNKEDEAGARKALEKVVNDEQELEEAILEMRKEYFASSDAISRFRFVDLFKARRLRTAVTISVLLVISQQWSGINAIFSYSNYVFLSAGVPTRNIQYAIMGTGVVNVLLTFINLPLMEKAGRRALLLYPSMAMLISMFLMIPAIQLQPKYAWLSYMSIILVLLYIMGFAMGLGCIPSMLPAEIFRQGPRGTVMSISQGFHWGMNLVVTFTFPFLRTALDAYIFLIYGVISFVTLIVALLFLPETMGRSLDEIIMDFKRGYLWRPFRASLYMYDDEVKRANQTLAMEQVDKSLLQPQENGEETAPEKPPSVVESSIEQKQDA